MITLDKIKIVSKVEDISVIDEKKFKKTTWNDMLYSLTFRQRNPYYLEIKIDYFRGELVVEFCGKILGKDYPKLISLETIKQCFQIINNKGFCLLNIDSIIRNAEVSKCDITKDVKGIDVKFLNSYIKSHISNYNKYVNQKPQKNKNLIIEKNVSSNRCKKRISIYNKQEEMNSADNIRYSRNYGLKENFDNTTRFELNLNSKEQVREALHIQDNKLISVLNSNANPIYDFLKEIVSQPEPVSITDWKSYTKLLVLKDCDFNLEKVEAKIRHLYPRGNSVKNIMKPYRTLWEQIDRGESSDYWNEILHKLE